MTVGRRRIGSAGPWVSELTYGTMRLPETIDGLSPADYLCVLHDHGIDTHHSSHEYDTHPAYLDALGRARRTGRAFRHVVKMSEPGFQHHRFDGNRLTSRVHEQLDALGASTITSLQWLFRTPDAGDTESRVATLGDQQEEIGAWVHEQIAAGTVANVSIFPYSPDFARAALKLGLSTTLATYLNRAELDYAPLLAETDGFLAIRPLAAGRLARSADEVRQSLRFPLLHPAVATSIVSIDSLDHLDAAVAAVSGLTPDIGRFSTEAGDPRPAPT